MEPFIVTYTGRRVNPLALRPDDIDIRDIAHALACTNRFAGHTPAPVSVAQHAVYVSRLSGAHARQGLLHDASEAYLGDVTKWVKQTDVMAAYREAEARAQAVIFRRFGCATQLAAEVERADRLMVRIEMHYAWQGNAIWLDGYGPPTADELARVGPWAQWTWAAAERMFLSLFERLFAVAA